MSHWLVDLKHIDCQTRVRTWVEASNYTEAMNKAEAYAEDFMVVERAPVKVKCGGSSEEIR